jgi:hypothetical protein
MRLLTIEYHWRGGPIPKEKQITIEVTDDIFKLIETNDIMFTKKQDGTPVVYIDQSGWRFKQR